MASVGHGTARQIIDSDGDVVGVTGNALDVHLKTGVASIDIGDVSLLLDGTAADYGAGDVNTSGRTLRVTLADDDPAVVDLAAMEVLLVAIDADTGSMVSSLTAIKAAVQKTDNLVFLDDSTFTQGLSAVMPIGAIAGTQTIGADKIGALSCSAEGYLNVELQANSGVDIGDVDVTSIVPGTGATNLGKAEDATHNSGDVGVMSLAVRTDSLAALADASGKYTPLQVNADGALYTYTELDTSVGTTNAFNVGGATAASGQRGIAPLIVMNEVAASPGPHADGQWTNFSADLNGSLYTTHGITGLASDDNPTVGTSAEQLITDGADGATACKRVDIMAHPSNTGYIWVGDSAVSVDGLNGGIRLSPGDFYSMDIDNTGDIYVIATVDTENVCYNYFT
jgi:hypothetical protein